MIKRVLITSIFLGLLLSAVFESAFGQTQELLPAFIKSGNLIRPRDTDADFILFGTSSTSNDKFSINLNGDDITLFGSGSFNGFGLTDCDDESQTLNWDLTTKRFNCLTDGTGGGVASNSLNFDEFQNPLVLDTNITTTSGSFTWDFGFTNFVNVGSASYSRGLKVGNNLFRISPTGVVSNGEWQGTAIADAFVADNITLTNLTQITNRSILDTTGTLTVARGGTGASSLTGILKGNGTLAFTALTTSAGLAGELSDETGTGALVFAGSPTLTGLTSTGTVNFSGATLFRLTTNGTVATTGDLTLQTASRSLDYFDGTNAIVKLPESCFTYYIESPTSSNPLSVGHKRFFDPFTITRVGSVASGSNAAGWNLRFGVPGTVTTNVFTLAKSASTSSSPIYTSFANSAILDGNVLDVRITSASATLKSFSVNVCGRYNH